MDSTAQMRATAKVILPEGRMRVGTIFWCSTEHARQYLEQHVAELIGPREAPVIGPSETKDTPAEKKTPVPDSAPAAPAGPLTGSAALTAPGRVPPSASSAGEKVSRPRKPRARKAH